MQVPVPVVVKFNFGPVLASNSAKFEFLAPIPTTETGTGFGTGTGAGPAHL
jgi:hypothetical protein